MITTPFFLLSRDNSAIFSVITRDNSRNFALSRESFCYHSDKKKEAWCGWVATYVGNNLKAFYVGCYLRGNKLIAVYESTWLATYQHVGNNVKAIYVG